MYIRYWTEFVQEKFQVNAAYIFGATSKKGIFTAFLQHFFKKRFTKDFISHGFSFLLPLAIQNHWETQSDVILDSNPLSDSSVIWLSNLKKHNMQKWLTKPHRIFGLSSQTKGNVNSEVRTCNLPTCSPLAWPMSHGGSLSTIFFIYKHYLELASSTLCLGQSKSSDISQIWTCKPTVCKPVY